MDIIIDLGGKKVKRTKSNIIEEENVGSLQNLRERIINVKLVLKDLFESNAKKQHWIDIFTGLAFAAVISVAIVALAMDDADSEKIFTIIELIISGIGILLTGINYLAEHHMRMVIIAKSLQECDRLLSSIERAPHKKKGVSEDYLKRIRDKFDSINTTIIISEEKII